MTTRGQLETGDTVRIRGERWVVQRHTVYTHAALLEVRGTDTANSGHRARFLLPFEPIEPVEIDRTPLFVRPPRWRRQARAILASATPRIDSLRAAPRARFDVLPYQLEPALAVTSGVACRLLIADDVGLGKTVQAGLIVAELLDRHPDARALVVCPAGLRRQWEQELRSRFDLAPAQFDAVGIARVASELDATANPWVTSPLIITSIDFIKRPEVMRAVEGLVWDVIVLDEAHHLATRSDRAIAASALASRARTLVMLSATPHSGDDTAFARLCALGDPTGKLPLILFRRTRADAGMPVRRHTRWLSVRRTAAETDMLHALLDYARRVWTSEMAADAARLTVSILLRRASSSASSLARSLERRLASLDAGGADTCDQLALPFGDETAADEEPRLGGGPALADASEEQQCLERVLALARLAVLRESKIAVLVRWLRRVREPVLVFTEYRDTLTHVKRMLVERGIAEATISELHGGLTRTDRLAAESSFVAGDSTVLLATDAASEGLNLHHRCRCVINLEVPWSPIRLEQRIGRVDRIGQHLCVHAINLVAAGTHELTTVRRLVERGKRAAGALREAGTSDLSTTAAVLAGIDVPEEPRVTLPPFIHRPDLAALAGAEASWIQTARRLGTTRGDVDRRPTVTILRRSPRQVLWVVDLPVQNNEGMTGWTALAALRVPVSRFAWTADHRLALDQSFTEDLGAIAAELSRPVIEAATASLPGAVDVATNRERAICAAIRLRHARVAADLLQPGLFDRRAERHAASQAEVLEEAIAHCQARLDDLARLTLTRAGAPALRFAVLL